MILRKPYAFIIKNFRKIHILMLALAAVIFFQNSQIQTFVGEFITTNSYNPMYESIRSYISLFNYFLMILVLAISVILMYVLRYKKKPWKAYLLPLVTYSFLFGVTIATKSFFNHYGDESSLVTIRTLSQLLQMGSIFQYIVFVLLFIRITGVDLKKFDFKNDPEFLEIKEEDREEFEVNFEIDKDSIVRFFKKQIRHITYLYQEHSLIFNVIFAIIFIGISGYTYYYFGILHKTYKEGDTFTALNYQIQIEDSYFTDKDYRGNVINKNKDYVAVVIRMKNNSSKRAITVDRFHLLNKSHAYSYTHTVDTSFQDLGVTYPERELKPSEEIQFYLIFEVDKNLKNSNFVLYYQDIRGAHDLLYRKVKLNPQDLHEIKTIQQKKLNQRMAISGIAVPQKSIELLEATIGDTGVYSAFTCTTQNCLVTSKQIQNPKGKILSLSFASNDFDDTEFVDFTDKYGSIVYQDSKGKKQTILIRRAVKEDYLGKKIYVNVPNEIEEAKSIQMIYTIRNQSFVYKIK